MDHVTSVVCVCETREQAQRALYNLQVAGIDLKTLSMATKEDASDWHDTSYYNVGEESLIVPGVGPVLVSGPLASWIVTACDIKADLGGLSIVAVALATLGIPGEDILHYETALRTGRHVLVVHGSPDAVARALNVIGGTTHCSHTVHGETVYDTVHGHSLLAEPALMY